MNQKEWLKQIIKTIPSPIMEKELERRELLEQASSSKEKLEHTLSIVSQAFNVESKDICPPPGRRRRRFAQIALARHALRYLLRKQGMTYTLIGQLVGDRDHASAINSVIKVQDTIDYNDDFARLMKLAQHQVTNAD